MLESVTESIRRMSELVDGIASAVDGNRDHGQPGLSQLAEVLRAEVTRFVAKVRAD